MGASKQQFPFKHLPGMYIATCTSPISRQVCNKRPSYCVHVKGGGCAAAGEGFGDVCGVRGALGRQVGVEEGGKGWKREGKSWRREAKA